MPRHNAQERASERKMKAARSPLFGAGGKRRRTPAGARLAAHPQERQHSAAAGGTRDRVRPAGALTCGGHAAPRQGSSPERAETRSCG